MSAIGYHRQLSMHVRELRRLLSCATDASERERLIVEIDTACGWLDDAEIDARHEARDDSDLDHD